MIQLKVNGVGRSFDGDPEMPLLCRFTTDSLAGYVPTAMLTGVDITVLHFLVID